VALNDYITALRDLVHDPSANFFTNATLTRYINDGRNRICQDTKCLRQLVPSITLTYNVEQYLINSSGLGIFQGRAIDVMEVDLYDGGTRYPLRYLPWSRFNTTYRYFTGNLQKPEAFTRMGGLSLFIGPTPNQNYNSDWIIAVNPIPLVDNTTVDEIPVPFTEPVVFWAAYLARLGEQSLAEADIFKQQYESRKQMVQRSFQTWVIPDPYADD
jgi:hypothetical protein